MRELDKSVAHVAARSSAVTCYWWSHRIQFAFLSALFVQNTHPIIYRGSCVYVRRRRRASPLWVCWFLGGPCVWPSNPIAITTFDSYIGKVRLPEHWYSPRNCSRILVWCDGGLYSNHGRPLQSQVCFWYAFTNIFRVPANFGQIFIQNPSTSRMPEKGI